MTTLNNDWSLNVS